MELLYHYASGVGVYITFALFFAGMAFQLWRFLGATRPKEIRRLPPPPPGALPKKKGKEDTAPKRRPGFWGLVDLVERMGQPVDRLRAWLHRSVAQTHPVMTAVTVTFHVLLFVTPIFLLAHNALIAEAIGFSLPSLPEGVSDGLTFVVLCCLGIFLFRRLFQARVRAITSGYDYVVLLVTALPFVTGFFCYHQWGSYQRLLTIHVLSGELMLILIPFTRLGHALFFFLYRFFIDNEYSFGQGRRIWSTSRKGA